MASPTRRGQALPEYLLLLAVLLLIALSGTRLIRRAYQSSEQAYDLSFMLPSP